MGGKGARGKGRKAGPKFVADPAFMRVEPTDPGWPQEWLCMNVMCRAKFWRGFGESEFCPSCRKCLPGARK